MADKIFYRELKGYKYQTVEPYVYETGIQLDQAVSTTGKWLQMTRTGRLTVKRGYAWDGPSGPTIDSKDFMRGSLVHDALYQLIREQKIPKTLRKRADQMLRDICLEDGMSSIRAEYVYTAVRAFGGRAIKPRKEDVSVISAP